MREYLPPPTTDCPSFDGDSGWTPLVDGVEYFTALDENLAALAPGDEVLLTGLELDPTVDLTGRRPGDEGYRPLLDRLEAAAAEGVDVRVLLAGKVVAGFVPAPGLAGFRQNRATCARLNAAPGLAGHALVDWSGPILGSNHQKSVVFTHAGVVTAFIGGLDLVAARFSAAPHRGELHGRRWGWHDVAVRLQGPAAARAHDVLLRRWHEAATLPPKPYLAPRLPLPRVNPPAAPAPATAAAQRPVPADGVSVRVVRSISHRKVDSVLPWRRAVWETLPARGVQEIFATLTAAIDAAERYVYIEDQYLYEYTGGRQGFELYPRLRDAAARGVKVILLGSGVRDPDDPGVNLRPINASVNRDLRTKILRRLDPAHRGNVGVYRLEHATVHAKLTLIDDRFAHIGSANLFSRSMAGVDCEIGAAVQTSTPLVRDLRVRMWAEHLRTPLTPGLAADLGDLDLALGMWDAAWLPADRPADAWHAPGSPPSFRPAERVLARVDR